MTIIVNEIKQIFTLKKVLLMVLITGLFYFLFISFYISHFPNGRPALDEYRISIEMLENYGLYMNEAEFLDFKAGYERQINEANEYLQSREDFVKAGITTYEDFLDTSLHDEVTEELRNQILFQEQVEVFWQLQEKKRIIGTYENRQNNLKQSYAHLGTEQEKRLNEIFNAEQETAVFSYIVFENYNDMIPYMATLILISIMLMISPIHLKDRLNRVNYLQYTSKTGRGIFHKKLLAAMGATLIITTLQLLLFFLVYTKNETAMFLKASVTSFNSYFVSWFPLTFMNYILLTVAGIYLLALVTTLIVVVISNRVPNYMTLIGVQIPLGALFIGLIFKWLIYRMTEINMPQYFLPLLYIFLSVSSIFAVTAETRRNRAADILS
ncbi:hypothetical protein [Alkaliphilus crotonatoxidans]